MCFLLWEGTYSFITVYLQSEIEGNAALNTGLRACLRRFEKKFGDATPMLLTVLVRGPDMKKKSSVSTKIATSKQRPTRQNKAWSVMGKDQLKRENRQCWGLTLYLSFLSLLPEFSYCLKLERNWGWA